DRQVVAQLSFQTATEPFDIFVAVRVVGVVTGIGSQPVVVAIDRHTDFGVTTLQGFQEDSLAGEEDAVVLEEGIRQDRAAGIVEGTSRIRNREVSVEAGVPVIADGFQAGGHLPKSVALSTVIVVVEHSSAEEAVPVDVVSSNSDTRIATDEA